MALLRDIGRHISADILASVSAWHRAEAMGTLVGALIALFITIAGLSGIEVVFAPQSPRFWAIAIGAYFLFLC